MSLLLSRLRNLTVGSNERLNAVNKWQACGFDAGGRIASCRLTFPALPHLAAPSLEKRVHLRYRQDQREGL